MVSESQITILKTVEINEASINLLSGSIVLVKYKKNVTLDVELQIRMRALFSTLTDSKLSKFIFMADEGFIFTKEAREFGPSLQEKSTILFNAIIVNNLAYRLIVNFYLRVFNPKGNYKMFKTIEEAVSWLQSVEDGKAKN